MANNNNNNNNPEQPNSTKLSPRLNGLDKPTVWHEFVPLAMAHKSVNLAQGAPDWDPPAFVVEAMKKATDPSFGRRANQYTFPTAHPPLAMALAQDYSKRWDIQIDPRTMIGTAVGSTNALFCALQGLLTTGDEVLMLEPTFDTYVPQVQMAGGKSVFCPLRPSGNPDGGANSLFQLDMDELRSCITPKTKVLLLNTPHNPTGKVFSRAELTAIAEVVKEHPQLNVITDEVYEHIVFDPENSPHVSMASIPGMFERTLTLSSSGKTFSCTGWKVGWAVGPPHLVRAMTSVQQWCNFAAPSPNQDAIAQCIMKAREPYEGHDSYYAYLIAEYKRKRAILVEALENVGMKPVAPDGGFFMMADTSGIEFPYDSEEKTAAMPVSPIPRDWSMSRWMTKTVGVTVIPPSAFYSPGKVDLAKNYVRVAFCKGDESLLAAKERLEKHFG